MNIDDTRVAFIGDTHGNTRWLVSQLYKIAGLGITSAFVCGDFGIWHGKHGQEFLDTVNAALEKHGITLYVTLGNHENYDIIDNWPRADDGTQWFRDNICVFPRPFRFTLNGLSVLSLGGAPSVDFPYRTKNIDWWSQEAITYDEACEAIDGGHADIMITHDAPDNGTYAVQTILDSNPFGFPAEALEYAMHGRNIMTSVVAEVKPKFLVHGHYHVVGDGHMGHGGRIIALNCDGRGGSVVILDTTDHLDVQWLDKIERGRNESNIS